MRVSIVAWLCWAGYAIMASTSRADTITAYRDCNQVIPDKDMGLVNVSLTISGSLCITDLDVTLNITHEYVNELEIVLVSPRQEEVILKKFQTTWRQTVPNLRYTVITDDGIPWTQAAPPFSTRIQPPAGEFLSILNNTNSLGTWSLRIHDRGYDHTGVLDNWSLTIQGTHTPEPTSFLILALTVPLMLRYRCPEQ